MLDLDGLMGLPFLEVEVILRNEAFMDYTYSPIIY